MSVGNRSDDAYFDLSKQTFVTGQPLIDQFHAMLVAAGLTNDEAAWLVLSPSEYDQLCSTHTDPPPTQLVRMGLVLTEF
jgi:hypothetical protein